MSNAARAVLSAAEIDLYGRQIKAFLDVAAKHREKYHNARTSAALLLISVKAQLPHGQYGKWLAANGIEERTAQRLVAEHIDPAIEERRLAAERQRQAQMRERAATPKPDKFAGFAASRPPQQPEPPRAAPKQYAQAAQQVSLARERLKRLVERMPDGIIDATIAFIEAQLRSQQ